MKELGKYRYLVFRPLCACGGKVSVHRLDPGSPLRFWGLDPRYLTCPSLFCPSLFFPSRSLETKGSSLVNQKHAVANGGLHRYNDFGKNELSGNH